ncbi:MAG: GNAT family N-acetyltransferase [Fidelibacterota bacterium]
MKKSVAITVKLITEERELEVAYSIRRAVFIEEQKVPAQMELDNFDKTASHVLAYIRRKAVGTARWRKTGKGIKLERFAVLKDCRRIGVGQALLEFILEHINSKETVYLHAQKAVIPFYERFDFQVEGELFSEAGILHRLMIYRRNSN